MITDKISMKVRWAHEVVADQMAEEYCRNVLKDTDNTFGTLDGLMSVFGFGIAERVRERASAFYRVHNLKFRPCLFRDHCMYVIKERLRTDSVLADKLRVIRAAQKAKYQAEIRAEHANYEPLAIS